MHARSSLAGIGLSIICAACASIYPHPDESVSVEPPRPAMSAAVYQVLPMVPPKGEYASPPKDMAELQVRYTRLEQENELLREVIDLYIDEVSKLSRSNLLTASAPMTPNIATLKPNEPDQLVVGQALAPLVLEFNRCVMKLDLAMEVLEVSNGLQRCATTFRIKRATLARRKQ